MSDFLTQPTDHLLLAALTQLQDHPQVVDETIGDTETWHWAG